MERLIEITNRPNQFSNEIKYSPNDRRKNKSFDSQSPRDHFKFLDHLGSKYLDKQRAIEILKQNSILSRQIVSLIKRKTLYPNDLEDISRLSRKNSPYYKREYEKIKEENLVFEIGRAHV